MTTPDPASSLAYVTAVHSRLNGTSISVTTDSNEAGCKDFTPHDVWEVSLDLDDPCIRLVRTRRKGDPAPGSMVDALGRIRAPTSENSDGPA